VDRIFAYLKGHPEKEIVYLDKHSLRVIGFVDGDFAGCEDSRNQQLDRCSRSLRYYILVAQGQKTIATPIDAEYIASAEAAKEAVWSRNFINDLRSPGIYIDVVPLC
jgi:hypothetical protein